MAEQLPETVDKMIERMLGNGPLSADDWQSVLIDIAFATTEGQDPTAMLALCKVLQHERLQQGHVIFREGDEGSDIYIVLSGSVEVTKRASSVPVNVCTAGSFFGELALLYSDPLRRSTMTACEPTHIARVEAAELVKHQIDLSLFAHAHKSYRDLKKVVLQGVEARAAEAGITSACMEVLQVCTSEPAARTYEQLDAIMVLPELREFFTSTLKNAGQRRAVSSVLRTVTFERDGVVCEEGESGNAMYIILWGHVSVSALNAATREKRHIRDLGPGDQLGELALISDGIRSTTVVAKEFTVLLELHRADYDKSFRQADEADIIEKVEALQMCPLFHGMSLKKLLRVAHVSELAMFTKGQQLLEDEKARGGHIYFVIRGPAPHYREGRVAGSTSITLQGQTYNVKLGVHGVGAILGVEGSCIRDEDSASHFTYTALSEVRVLGCNAAILLRRCDPEFVAGLREYADACLSRAEVERLILVQTSWIQTRSKEFHTVTGLLPTLRNAGGSSGDRRGRSGHASRAGPSSFSGLPRHTSDGSKVVTLREKQMLPRSGPSTLTDTKTDIARVAEELACEAKAAQHSRSISLQFRSAISDCNDMIELREKAAEQRRSSTPTPPIVVRGLARNKLPEEATRRLMRVNLWDPLVRMNLATEPRREPSEARGISSSAPPKPGASAESHRAAGTSMVDVDLGDRLPKQVGSFTEMVYDVTVLVANVSFRLPSGAPVPGLSWHYFRDRLFNSFEEQAHMRGLMRCQGSHSSRFMLIGGMPHTRSFTSGGPTRSACLVADAAKRIVEDAEASNAHHEMEQRHKSVTQEAEGHQTKSFEVSVTIGVASGNVAISVFGQRRPIYYGACGSEVDAALSMANTPHATDSTAIMLSNTANELVKDAFFTTPRTVLVQTGGKEAMVNVHVLTGKRDQQIRTTQQQASSARNAAGGQVARWQGSSPRLTNRTFRQRTPRYGGTSSISSSSSKKKPWAGRIVSPRNTPTFGTPRGLTVR